jgi:hypothetical protein
MLFFVIFATNKTLITHIGHNLHDREGGGDEEGSNEVSSFVWALGEFFSTKRRPETRHVSSLWHRRAGNGCRGAQMSNERATGLESVSRALRCVFFFPSFFKLIITIYLGDVTTSPRRCPRRQKKGLETSNARVPDDRRAAGGHEGSRHISSTQV